MLALEPLCFALDAKRGNVIIRSIIGAVIAYASHAACENHRPTTKQNIEIIIIVRSRDEQLNSMMKTSTLSGIHKTYEK